jgi:hypothetical protein
VELKVPLISNLCIIKPPLIVTTPPEAFLNTGDDAKATTFPSFEIASLLLLLLNERPLLKSSPNWFHEILLNL